MLPAEQEGKLAVTVLPSSRAGLDEMWVLQKRNIQAR